MRKPVLLAIAAAIALSPSVSLAGGPKHTPPGHERGPKHIRDDVERGPKHGHDSGYTHSHTANAGAVKHCPPGLAKKNPPCIPPGQAKKIYGRGDILHGDYVLIEYPDRYGLDPRHTYYRLGDHVYRVDRETKEVLDLIGAVAAVLH
ncbi:hypothetical protein ACUXV3_05575 [Roseobacteraceae bacterium NS-SX3]